MEGFDDPPGDAHALDRATTSLASVSAGLRRQDAALRRGVGEARGTWHGPRATDFAQAADGLLLRIASERSSTDAVVSALGDFATVLRTGCDDMDDLRQQARRRHTAAEDAVAGRDPGDPTTGTTRQAADQAVADLRAQADAIRARVRRHATATAAALDLTVDQLLPGGSTLAPDEIARQVHAASGVTGTLAAIAGDRLTEAEAWNALDAAQELVPPPDWRRWAKQYGLPVPDPLDPERGLALKAQLDDAIRRGLVRGPAARAALLKAFAGGLSGSDQVTLAMFAPELVGNLDGMPNALRYTAGKVNLDRGIANEQDRMDAWQPPPSKDDTAYTDWVRLQGRIDLLTRLLDDEQVGGSTGPHQVLAFVPPTYAGNHPLDDGRLAVVVGNLDAAAHVGVVVPGITNRIDNFAATLDKAAVTQKYDDASATVAWLGYDTPEFQDSMTTDDADRGGHALHDFLQGIQRTKDSELVVLAHSYGTLVTSKALQDWRPGELLPDRIVLFGSPGLGENIASTDDLGLPRGYPIYAMRAPGDPVAITAGHGIDPVDLPGITRLDTDWSGKEDVTGHSAYTLDGSDSLTNLVDVLSGHLGDLVVGGNPLDRDGLAGAYNQDIRTLVDLLQKQVPNAVTSSFVGGIEAELERMITAKDPPDFDDIPRLDALLRRSAHDSGLDDHLTQDELEQSLIDAGFTDTLAHQAGDKVEHVIDGLDRLDDLRVPVGPTILGHQLSISVPDGINEVLGSLAGAGTSYLTKHLSDLAVQHLPSLSKVLGYADAVVNTYHAGTLVLGQVKDAVDAGVATVKDLGKDAVDTGEDVVTFLVPGI